MAREKRLLVCKETGEQRVIKLNPRDEKGGKLELKKYSRKLRKYVTFKSSKKFK